jgi:hypothetical protein
MLRTVLCIRSAGGDTALQCPSVPGAATISTPARVCGWTNGMAAATTQSALPASAWRGGATASDPRALDQLLPHARAYTHCQYHTRAHVVCTWSARRAPIAS